jgi:N-formylglutamate amidohydrolase
MDEKNLEKIRRITWAEFKKNIADKKPFEGVSPLETAYIKIQSYEPIVGLAIHAGHRVREELQSKMAITEEERLYEEDAGVDQFIQDFPIQMIGLDSRYEYDVNRNLDCAVYLKPFQCWGKRVWITPPTKEELQISHQKWEEFHEMLQFLVGEISNSHGKTFVLDMHSYNYQRPNPTRKPELFPDFNLAVSPQDHSKHRNALDALTQELKKIELQNGTPTVKENDIFKKDGAVATKLEELYPHCLITPVEIKKVYMNEKTGELNKNMINQLRKMFLSIAKKTTAAMRK